MHSSVYFGIAGADRCLKEFCVALVRRPNFSAARAANTGGLYEMPAWNTINRSDAMIFRDRAQAGLLLARKLEKFRDNAVIYALPRGGVVLGAVIARELKIPLDMIVARKIGHPLSAEYAIGAVTENGVVVLDDFPKDEISERWLRNAIQSELREAKRRRELYSEGRIVIPAKNRVAILVDDGIATGLTMRAAVEDIKKQEPASIVIAVPVSPRETAQRFRGLVDEFVALDIPNFYAGAVGAYFMDFPQLDDDEIIRILNLSRTKSVEQNIS